MIFFIYRFMENELKRFVHFNKHFLLTFRNDNIDINIFTGFKNEFGVHNFMYIIFLSCLKVWFAVDSCASIYDGSS